MNSTGIIFDIQRFALHDGPGIRTTVFLKGCPLHCAWCHNPESIDAAPQLSYNDEKCVHCGACAKVCPVAVHTVTEAEHSVDFSRCTACGACVSACAYGALTMIGRQMTVDDVTAEVVKDLDYYRASGGGITLSGGEPMRQFDAAREILTRAKQAGIHTCLDTCGHAPQKRYEEILPLVDLFLYDYKATDPAQHERLTGVDNRLILSNLELLMKRGAAVTLRCPLVPGVNDTAEHLSAIADLSRTLGGLKAVELMAFHDMGRDKSRRIGRETGIGKLPTTSAAEKSAWIEKLQTLGCRNVSFG